MFDKESLDIEVNEGDKDMFGEHNMCWTYCLFIIIII